MIRSIIAAGVLAGSLGVAKADMQADAVDVAMRFCAAQNAGDPRPLRSLTTSGLAAVITEAEARNDAIAETSGRDAAPLAGGIPLKSMAEEARCTPGPVSTSDNLTIVSVGYVVDNGQSWTDRLVLKVEAGQVRIDDILFASFPSDTYQASLRRVLADTFDQ